ncbi:MAG: 4-(cytidine 5'-diphospho)-2-C-methyl-D-erythritol kinase [Dehalococcoidia bacterium]|jgi:4-diphosphocytidyl-2-C-methyl-D-erythritol kinase
MRLRLVSAAKLNWTLEVLGRRDDGYHEISTVLQTLDLHDEIVLSTALALELKLSGRVDELGDLPPERNLAYRAAIALREEAGDERLGALIELEKAVPAAAGLGGGSSNAAAVLRGLNRLWGLGLSLSELSVIGSKLGADVPFFLRGGTAQAGGRGDEVIPFPNVRPQSLLLAVPSLRLPGKTAHMYGHLTPEHYSDGGRTQRLVDRLRSGKAMSEGDLFNVFEAVLPPAMPDVAAAMRRCAGVVDGAPHLAGSGPSFFFLSTGGQEDARLRACLAGAACELFPVRTSAAVESVAWEEL